MKYLNLIIFGFILISCDSKSELNHEVEGVDTLSNENTTELELTIDFSKSSDDELLSELKNKIEDYTPSSVDMGVSISDSIKDLFKESIGRDLDVEYELNLLILLTHEYNLKRACRGYDIMFQKDEAVAIIIDKLMICQNIEAEQTEMINSHIIYESIKQGEIEMAPFEEIVKRIDLVIDSCYNDLRN